MGLDLVLGFDLGNGLRAFGTICKYLSVLVRASQANSPAKPKTLTSALALITPYTEA